MGDERDVHPMTGMSACQKEERIGKNRALVDIMLMTRKKGINREEEKKRR
jgi:hypothetical protein